MSGLSRRAWNETRRWRSASRAAAVLGFVVGIGVPISVLHHVGIARTIVIPLLAGIVAGTLIPAAAFVARLARLPHRRIVERLDEIEARLAHEPPGLAVDLDLRELETLDD